MKCSNCGEEIQRYPCKSCGKSTPGSLSSRRPAEMKEKVPVAEEESLVKPSELLKQKNKEEEEPEEHLVKPSEILKKKAEGKEEVKDDEEHLLKPSELLKKKEKASLPPKPVIDKTGERLRKPSEVLKKINKTEIVSRDPSEESLLKPSELLKQKNKTVDEPSEEQLLRPSQLAGRSPSEVSKRETRTTVQSATATIKKAEPQLVRKNPDETDEEYKNRVKDTLVEVISLLEKLVE